MDSVNKINFNFIKPFSPLIVITKIPNNIIDKLNNFFDNHLNDEYANQFNAGKKLVGNVTQELDLNNKILIGSGWKEFLFFCITQYVHHSTQMITKQIELHGTWIVRQYCNEYNPVHWHTGHISGAGYLKVPNTMGKSFQLVKEKNLNGNIQLIHGSKSFLSSCVYNHEPKLGDFILFPSYLMHQVYPFYGTNEERRSISFNASIDQDIYNQAN